jgi:hypothetical protein
MINIFRSFPGRSRRSSQVLGFSPCCMHSDLTSLSLIKKRIIISYQLMENQDDYFDIPSSQRTPLETREKLAELAEPIIGKINIEHFKDLLRLKDTPNGGNAVTDDLKYTSMFLALH